MSEAMTDFISKDLLTTKNAKDCVLVDYYSDLTIPLSSLPRPSNENRLGITEDVTQVLEESNKNEVTSRDAKKKIKTFCLKKGQRYTDQFKQKVLNYAVNNNFKKASRKFNVNANTISEWAREYKRLLSLKKSTTSRRGSKTDSLQSPANNYETVDLTQWSSGDTFIDWLKGKRVAGVQVTRDDLLTTARTYYDDNKNGWFEQWVCRLRGTNHPTTSNHHIFYPDCFKIEVVLYAKEYTKRIAAQVFGISSRRIYDWCSPEPEDVSIADTKLEVEHQLKVWYEEKLVAGIKPRGSEVMAEARTLYASNGIGHIKCSKGWLEKFQRRNKIKMLHNNDDSLLMWILGRLDNNCSVSVTDVTLKARQFATDAAFKGSKTWTLRFLKRHNQLLQLWNTQLELLPSSAIAQSRVFRRSIQDRIFAVSLSPECIGCMDEIPIHFTFPSEKVHTPRLLRQTSLKSAVAVIILSATSDGRLLPPAVVFKGTGTNALLYEQVVPVIYQQEGVINVDILTTWFSHIWMRYVKPPSVMIADSFDPHRNEVLHETFSTGNCNLTIIPAGCALLLQPFAFNLSQRFEELIQDEWRDSCRKNNAPRQADETTILKWTLQAYEVIRRDSTSIISSFKLSGLIPKTYSIEM